jgi:SsrA-binding protein
MKITNKRAFFDYEIKETVEAGINLYGSEVKAIRLGHVDLTGSHARIMGSEAYLINAKILPYKYSRPEGYNETRSRKLLLHKKEIISLKSKLDGEKLSLIPVSLYQKHGYIKVELGLGKGKKQFDKRKAIKKKGLQREMEIEAKL